MEETNCVSSQLEGIVAITTTLLDGFLFDPYFFLFLLFFLLFFLLHHHHHHRLHTTQVSSSATRIRTVSIHHHHHLFHHCDRNDDIHHTIITIDSSIILGSIIGSSELSFSTTGGNIRATNLSYRRCISLSRTYLSRTDHLVR